MFKLADGIYPKQVLCPASDSSIAKFYITYNDRNLQPIQDPVAVIVAYVKVVKLSDTTALFRSSRPY